MDKKKLISILLAFCTVCLCLSSCSKQEESSHSQESIQTVSESVSPTISVAPSGSYATEMTAIPSEPAAFMLDIGEPFIPLGEDLRPYQPEVHGYYGHLPIRVTEEYEATEYLLPVLVYHDHVFADAESLTEAVSGLSIIEDESDVYVTALGRELIFPIDSPIAHWTVSSSLIGKSVFIEKDIELSARAWHFDGKLWVPFTDVAGLMGMDLRVAVYDNGQSALMITPPLRSMTDVFADLASPAFRQMMIFRYPEECADDIRSLYIGTAISLGIDEFISNLSTLELSGDFIDMVNGVSFQPVLLKIAGIEENELASLSNSILGNLNTYIGVPGTNLMNPVEIRPVIDTMQIVSALMLDTGNMAITGEGALAAFTNRDQLAIDSMTFFSEHAKGMYLDENQTKKTSIEIEKLSSSDRYAIASMEKSSLDLVGDSILTVLSFGGSKAATTLSLISGVYQMIQDSTLENMPWWSGTMEKMEAFQDSWYGILLEKESEELLQEQLDAYVSIEEGVSTDVNRNMSLSSYMFLKSCLVTRRSALQALGRENQMDAAEKETIDILTRDLTILTMSTADPDHYTPEALIRSAISADQSAVALLVRPYYLWLDGKVLQYGTWYAVQDAKVDYFFGERETGYISGTPGGYYQNICVPFGVPQLTLSDTEMELKAVFSSTTVLGEDTITVTPSFGQHIEADTAFLRQMHTVEVTAADKDGNRVTEFRAVAVRQETDPAFRVNEPWEIEPVTVSRNTGTLAFRLPEGEYMIEASADDYADGSVMVSVMPDSEEPLPVHITLLDGCTVTGYVLDAGNKEVAPGFVNITLTQEHKIKSLQTNGDPMTNTKHYITTGSFKFAHVPFGTWQLTVSCPGYYDFTETLTLHEGRDEEFQKNILLRPKGPYEGKRSQVLYIGYDLIAINTDGTVKWAGYTDNDLYFYSWTYDEEGNRYYDGWTDVQNIVPSNWNPVGVSSSGRVLSLREDTQDWNDIRMIAFCYDTPYGLKNDGTVIKHAYSYETKSSVMEPLGDKWTHVIQLVSYNDSLLGLKDDGTVVCQDVGTSAARQKIERWTDIICVGFCGVYAMGVKSNGTIVRCPIHSPNFRYGTYMECLEWEDLVKVTGNDRIIVGLTANGRVLISDPSSFISEETQLQIAELDNIVDVYCSRIGNSVFCITKDGSLLAFGDNLIELYPSEIFAWEGIRTD